MHLNAIAHITNSGQVIPQNMEVVFFLLFFKSYSVGSVYALNMGNSF